MPFAPEDIKKVIKMSVFHKIICKVQKINIEVVTSIFTSIVQPINPQTCVFLIEDSLRSRFVTAHELKQIQMHTVYYL